MGLLNLTNAMAPKVEVLYFDTYGRVEIIRTILNYGGIEFEDKRFQVEEWAATKPTTKFGFVPQVTWDGKVMAQSNTITRFVAREVGIAGKNNMEMAQCDAIVDFCSEMVAAKATQEDKDKFKGKLNNFIKNMEKLLDENGGEWMVGKGFTWADLYVAVVLNHWTKRCARMEFESPKLAAHSQKVYNIPKIKAYIDKRPERPM